MARPDLELGDKKPNPVSKALLDSENGYRMMRILRWQAGIALTNWSAEEIMGRMQVECDLATCCWPLVDRARIEQALKILAVRLIAEVRVLHLRALVSVHTTA